MTQRWVCCCENRALSLHTCNNGQPSQATHLSAFVSKMGLFLFLLLLLKPLCERHQNGSLCNKRNGFRRSCTIFKPNQWLWLDHFGSKQYTANMRFILWDRASLFRRVSVCSRAVFFLTSVDCIRQSIVSMDAVAAAPMAYPIKHNSIYFWRFSYSLYYIFSGVVIIIAIYVVVPLPWMTALGKVIFFFLNPSCQSLPFSWIKLFRMSKMHYG